MECDVQVLAPTAVGFWVFICHLVAIPIDGCSVNRELPCPLPPSISYNNPLPPSMSYYKPSASFHVIL